MQFSLAPTLAAHAMLRPALDAGAVMSFTAILRTRRKSVAAKSVAAKSVAALFATMVGVLVPTAVYAHFILMTPDSWMSQDSFGLPEKLGPCGDEGGGTPTGKITTFLPGQTISITINEVIPHPGHYRVALAVHDHSELPSEPAVTPTSGDPCGSVVVQNPPVFPILADNMLPHTQPFTKPQTFTVTLPTDITCTRCTLQVLEFMSSHPQPCFYHHCADIAIAAAAPSPTPTPTLIPTPTPNSTDTPTATEIPTPSTVPTPAPTFPPCLGDCDHNRQVTVDELVVGVRIALAELSPQFCPAFAGDGAAVSVDQLVLAVNNALKGCGQ